MDNFVSTNNAPVEILKPGVQRRILRLDNLMTVVVDFEFPMRDPDPFHSHPHEQTTYVAEGETWFFIENEKFRLAKGDMIKIPAGAKHTIQTITPHVRLIDNFSPAREDFIKN